MLKRFLTLKSASVLRNEQGDTIVEVLISIAIVTLVLVAAYQTSIRSSAAVQSNQERIQAQHLVEAQIESLRAKGSLTGSSTCFGVQFGTPQYGLPTSAANCVTSAVNGSGATYTVVITRPGVSFGAQASTTCGKISSTADTICAYWTGISDKTNNASNVTMYYLEPTS